MAGLLQDRSIKDASRDDSDLLIGTWDAVFIEGERRLVLEYVFQESGSGHELIRSTSDSTVEELHRFFWNLYDGLLKLAYITENMREFSMLCHFSEDRCVLTDRQTRIEQMVLSRKRN